MTSDYAKPNAVLEVAAISIALYLAITLVMGAIHFVSGLIYLWAFSGKDFEASILMDLRAAKLPGPSRYQAKTFDYLIELADTEHVPADIRVRAGSLYASYQIAIQRAGLFGGIALAKALDDATLRYAREAPQPNGNN